MKRIVLLLVVVAMGTAIGRTIWKPLTEDRPAETNWLELHGNVDVRQVDLTINGAEHIAKLWVEEGEKVVTGQKLAQLELRRFRLAVAAAQHAVAAQEQVVAELEAGSRPEEIAKAEADYQAALALQEEARRRLERVKRLVESNAAPQQQLDDAQAAYDAAQARTAAAKAALDLVQAGPRAEQIARAKALLELRRTELRVARHNLAEATLRAPADGIIQARILEVGDMSSPQQAVYTLALHDPIWVRAYVSEPDLGKIREGMPAEIYTDSFPDKAYDGWVGFISPTAEFTPKPVETREVRTKLVYQVRVFAENPRGELRLGMPATVRIDLRTSGSADSQAAREIGKATDDQPIDRSPSASVQP